MDPDHDALRFIARLKKKALFHQSESARIQKLIADIQAEALTDDSREPESNLSGRHRKERTLRTRVGSKQRPASQKSGPEEPPAEGRSVAKLIREAVRAQTKAFTVIDIRAYIDERYPAVASHINNGRISRELYAARKAKIIAFDNKAEKGGAHTYLLNQ